MNGSLPRLTTPSRGPPPVMRRLPLLLLTAAALLCRPAAATILVIEQHDDAAEYQLEDSPSRFGPRVGMTGLGGYLIMSNPEDACSPVWPPPRVAGHHHWLLLVRDGNCSSGLKVLNAQRAGFLAAIVYNTTGDGFSPMQSDVSVNIPSFYIGLSNGIMLLSNFLYGSGYSVYISGYFPYTFLAFIIPAMLLVVLCLLVLIAIMLYRCISEYRRTARRLLPKRMLAQIPTRRYTTAGEAPDGQETCAICLEDYQEGDQLRLLPCRHAFHCGCVDPWLLRSRRVCPVCKRRLVSATVAVLVSDSEEDQLLPAYRNPRAARPPARRSYGATLTARGVPPAPATTGATGDQPRVSARSRSARRQRRTRRRSDSRSRPAGPPPEECPGAAVPVTADDVSLAADYIRLLSEDRSGAAEEGAAAASPAAGDEEPTVAPCGGDHPKLLPGQYTRLQEPNEGEVAVDVSTTGPEVHRDPSPPPEGAVTQTPSPSPAPAQTPSPSPAQTPSPAHDADIV